MRLPTPQEKMDLLEHILVNKYKDTPTQEERDEEEENIDRIWICVFDDYITDGPGYAGPVMVVVWGGDPSFTETYIWMREILPNQQYVPISEAKMSPPYIHQVRIET
jgi:hypothetical protein